MSCVAIGQVAGSSSFSSRLSICLISFLTQEKPKIAKTITNSQDIIYEAISVDIPEFVINEQKERAASAPSRSYFGRQVVSNKLVKSEITKDQGELFTNNTETTTAVTNSMRKTVSDKIIYTEKDDNNSENSFDQIGEIQLSTRRSIVVSSCGCDSYWFNEKVNDPNYSGFTQKGFGLKANDWSDFKSALANISSDSSAEERRFKINDSTELVVYHTSPDIVDIRQYITSEKYTGWTKKGIRVTNENAKKIVEQLAALCHGI